MPKFRKKPVVIDAVLWDGSIEAWLAITAISFPTVFTPKDESFDFYISTLEGDMLCRKGDWVIKGVNGEFYPCKPDIFEKTYDIVEDSE